MNTPKSTRNRNSRYVQGGTSTVTQKSVGWWERNPTFSVRAVDDITVLALPMVYEGRADLLAHDLYGRSDLEWVILQYNNIVDVTEEFVAGATIVAPSKARVFGSILSKTIDYSED